MILFPYPVVVVLVAGALVLTAVGLASLLLLLAKDNRDKSIW